MKATCPAVRCSRCGQDRWPTTRPTGPYTCQRCQEHVRGGNAVDPRSRSARRGSESPPRRAGRHAVRRSRWGSR